jgi:hypothetical protein
MTNIYKIGFEGEKGQAYASYTDGILRMFINDISKFSTPPRYIPIKEEHIHNLASTHVVKLVEARSVADKVAHFCIKYREHKGVAYRAGKEEKANLKGVTINDQLLNTYFTAIQYPFTQTKTMADYVRHYNAVRDLAANGKQVKSSFPDVYDKEYEKRLGDDVSKLQRYWQHLRSLGWSKVEGIWKHKGQ